jgi:hypothetical protein
MMTRAPTRRFAVVTGFRDPHVKNRFVYFFYCACFVYMAP